MDIIVEHVRTTMIVGRWLTTVRLNPYSQRMNIVVIEKATTKLKHIQSARCLSQASRSSPHGWTINATPTVPIFVASGGQSVRDAFMIASEKPTPQEHYLPPPHARTHTHTHTHKNSPTTLLI